MGVLAPLRAAASGPVAPAQIALTTRPGPVVTLASPVRVYDSRTDPAPGRSSCSGDRVAVSMGPAIIQVPAIQLANAVFVNVTITETEGAGFLVITGSVATGLGPDPTTSNINWWSDGQTLANLVLSTLGFESSVSVMCGGAGRTHVICDLCGYVEEPQLA